MARLTALMIVRCPSSALQKDVVPPLGALSIEKLEFATSTPFRAAHTYEQMTAWGRKMSLVPTRTLALMTASFTFGAMPTIPRPFASAAMTPATFVPWPESSFHAAGSPLGAPLVQETLREASTLPSRSGCEASTPVSMTPTVTSGLPPVIAWASGALIRFAHHWSGENVSPSATGSLGSLGSPRQALPGGAPLSPPVAATPSTDRSRSSAAAKPGLDDSATTTPISGYAATSEPPARCRSACAELADASRSCLYSTT